MNIDIINVALEKLIPNKESLLFEAAHYSLQGGKRLRPLLFLAVLESASTPIEKGLYPACAIEMIHTYSLIHDDLPCIDNDNIRRGKPSLHKAYCESHALLVGDFLLTYAFEVICIAQNLTVEEKLKLTQTIAKAAGSNGMIGAKF